ncbi:MAG: formylglycine-generating enzyme family protein, partial [Phycisphaeraceae bacterium]|nr:formylglycine-generating enzyme family protein [Phycisphaeraceae bacterium]
KFMMGASPNDQEAFNDEKPRHEVTIPSPLYVGRFPITQRQWQAVMGDNSAYFQRGEAINADTNNHPVESVSWEDCRVFLHRVCERVDLEFGKTIRLLTEAEWEYACRAGTTDSRYGNLDDIGWFDGNNGGTTHPVGAKRANAWGLYDMIGNVLEWCEDNLHYDYEGAPSDGSARTGGDTARVLRGGGWYGSPQYCRSSDRYWGGPGYRDFNIGFRVVVDLE